jgi:hypothetical protein
MTKQLCLEETALTACHQQGLIHIFRNYCRQGSCAQCPLIGSTGPQDSDKFLETRYHIHGGPCTIKGNSRHRPIS